MIGIGTRYSDFTTASRTAFNNPDVRFVNINVASLRRRSSRAACRVVADAREAHRRAERGARRLLGSRDEYRARTAALAQEWDDTVVGGRTAVDDDGARAEPEPGDRPGQHAVRSARRGGVRSRLDARRPAQALAYPGSARATTSSTATPAWVTRSQAGSASGWPSPDRDVFVMVGDGSYLMMATELVTAVQEGIKVIVVLVQNHGFASIGSLSEALGSQRFGTAVPLPQRRRSARRRQAARRPRRQRGQPGRRRDQGRDGRGVQPTR